MPSLKPVYIVTPAGNLACVARKSLGDKELKNNVLSQAACSDCDIYFLKSRKVTACGHRVCNQCWTNNGERCPKRGCGDDKILESYDISGMKEITKLFVNCPKDGCTEILSYAESDSHIASHHVPDSGQNIPPEELMDFLLTGF